MDLRKLNAALDRLLSWPITPVFGYVYRARDEMRALISEHRPDLLDEFDEATTGPATFHDTARFLDRHFPDHAPWGPEDPARTPAIMRRLLTSSAL